MFKLASFYGGLRQAQGLDESFLHIVRPPFMSCFRRIIRNMLVIVMGCIMLPPMVHAFEFDFKEMGVSYGYGIDVSQWVQLDMISPVNDSWDVLESVYFYPYVDIGFATTHWKSSRSRAYHMSIKAMLRSAYVDTPAGDVFFEVGFGPHLISTPGKTARLGTAFEFNSHAGLGLVLSKRWSSVVRAQHLSNGGLTRRNSGVNVYLWQLHYQMDD